jgi:hypothetical protein
VRWPGFGAARGGVDGPAAADDGRGAARGGAWTAGAGRDEGIGADRGADGVGDDRGTEGACR